MLARVREATSIRVLISMDVSVVIPTRNRSRLLNVALRSALRQRGVDLEVIVVDEASTDDTPALLAAVGDARVRILRHEAPRGLSAARNHGAEEAHGEWIAFLDDDDLWAPEKLVRQLDAAQKAGCEWVYTGSVNFEGARILYSQPPVPPEEAVAMLPRYNAIPGGGSNVVWRRSAWLQVGPFDPRFQGGEDWDMSIRSARRGPPAWVCSPLMAKRVHSTNMFLDVTAVVKSIRLIESVHQTPADWGKLHRWLAGRSLQGGLYRAALGHFARAAAQGQWRAVASDLTDAFRRRVGRVLNRASSARPGDDVWRAAAVAWLREYEPGIE